MFFADLFLERAVLAPQSLTLLRLAQRENDLVVFERLLHVIVRARFDGLERIVDVSVRAHHDHRRFVPLGLQCRQEIEPSHFGHTNVGENDIGTEGVDQRQCFFAALRRFDFVPLALQERA
jgi:hypothetical protein